MVLQDWPVTAGKASLLTAAVAAAVAGVAAGRAVQRSAEGRRDEKSVSLLVRQESSMMAVGRRERR